MARDRRPRTCGFLTPARWSVRGQLVVWNSAALVLLLAVIGLVAHYSVRSFLLAAVDRELDLRADRFVHVSHGRTDPTGGPPPEGGPHGEPTDGLGAMLWSWVKGLPAAQDARMARHRPASPVTYGRADQAVYAPRLIDAQGRVVGPPDVTTVPDPAAVRRALLGRDVYSVVEVNGERLRVLTRPLSLRPPIRGVVQAPYPLREVDLALEGWARVGLLLIPFAILCAGLGGYLLTGRVLRPVQSVTKAAANMSAADLSDRLPVVGRDEFAELAATFNGMLGRLDVAFHQQAALVEELRRLVEQQRRFTADASHELRTPLTVIKANASLCLQDERVAGDLRQSLEDVNAAADRMSQLVQDLLLLARSDGRQLGRNRRPVPLHDVLARAVAMASPDTDVTIDLPAPPPDLRVDVDDDEMVRVFTNLLENAVRWTPAGGRVAVSACVDQGRVRVAVADHGVGIAPEHLPHLGERFYRVDSARSRPDGGSGLGLSICREILDAHGGEMRFESEVGVGTTVTVTLPLAGAACATDASTA